MKTKEIPISITTITVIRFCREFCHSCCECLVDGDHYEYQCSRFHEDLEQSELLDNETGMYMWKRCEECVEEFGE